MDKLLEFGRKAFFYARVLSGYEQWRIRSYRLKLDKRLQQAQQRKAAVNKIPEQIVLSEVRRMVEDMQALNKRLEETEAVFEEQFKHIDREAEIMMKMRLEGEEKTMNEMMKEVEQQALLKEVEAEKLDHMRQSREVPDQPGPEPSSNGESTNPPKEAGMR